MKVTGIVNEFVQSLNHPEAVGKDLCNTELLSQSAPPPRTVVVVPRQETWKTLTALN